MEELRRQIEIHREAVVRDLLKALHLMETIPDEEMTPELRALQDEHRAALREDLMKLTGDHDGRQLRARIDEFRNGQPPTRKAG
jgi:hypothetical protein